MLHEYGCRDVVVVQPEGRSKKKTDRRDASALSQLLWINRQRFLEGKRVCGLRHVILPSQEDAEARQATTLRHRLGRLLTRTKNKVQRILLKHNLQQECPTKGIRTKAARRWLTTLELNSIDRMEMDLLLAQWKLWDKQHQEVEKKIARHFEKDETAQLLATIPGLSAYSSLAIASRIGDITRFPRPGSLANYWGLTPGCRNTDSKERLGSITKAGSPIVRHFLGQAVLHLLRGDVQMKGWFQRIKRRRGAKIARVAVMRRLATIIWHMVTKKQPYQPGRMLRPTDDQAA
jgi:transposase